MSNQTLRKIAMVLLILLFFMPLIGTMMISAGATAETKQYDGLQLIVMGVYNIPFLIVSLSTLLVGRSIDTKLKEKTSNILFVISIGSSIVGSILMLTWALGAK